jgi:coniferyl-aldehyde dehydrogenase
MATLAAVNRPATESNAAYDSGDQATVASALASALDLQRRAARAEPMPSAAQRIVWLKALKKALIDNQQALIDAISADFAGRAAEETQLAEMMPSIGGINYAIRNVKRWMRTSYRNPGLQFLPAVAKVVYQPLGVVGIVVPWNYPVFLAAGPLASALAAGNRAMVKMSEYTPRTSELFADIIAKAFAPDIITVVNGDARIAAEFSRLPFDHLIFTGSTSVGRHVMAACAPNLTPVTLELGGKSPVIIDKDAPMGLAAERICFGKSMNAGQTCVAPDYILAPKERVQEFVTAYRDAFTRAYGNLHNNAQYTSIVDERQRGRLQQWLDDASAKGAEVIQLAEDPNDGSRRMAPRLLLNCNDKMTVMQQEIFGPLMPVVPYDTLDQALGYINERPRPLALYYFGMSGQNQRKVLERTHSGGVCINDTLMHVAVDDIPFGGVGPSGMGHYHGREGFLTLSKAKGVFSKGRLNSSKLIYPPYKAPILKALFGLFIR